MCRKDKWADDPDELLVVVVAWPLLPYRVSLMGFPIGERVAQLYAEINQQVSPAPISASLPADVPELVENFEQAAQ